MSEETETDTQKLHLGCGRDVLPGWVNLDLHPGPGIDVVANLDECGTTPLPFDDNTFDELLGSHLIEHLRNPLELMQELHRISKAGATATFKTPYGSSDDAFEDPTHVRQYFRNSWGYFSQPFYWRADYQYRGDWKPQKLILAVRNRYPDKTPKELMQIIDRERNVVVEMTAILECIKPIREAKKELQRAPAIEIQLVNM